MRDLNAGPPQDDCRDNAVHRSNAALICYRRAKRRLDVLEQV